MHLLLFVSHIDPPGASSLLDRAHTVLREVMPPFPVALSSTVQKLPEIAGGWLTIEPAPEPGQKRFHTKVAPDLALLVYGELFGVDEGEAIHVVERAWRAGGAGAVRHLDGCFSAVVVDRAKARCTVVSDILARRTLRFFHDGPRTLVSTHDAALVATGLIRPSFNLEAIGSSAALGWSLGGTPLLDGVKAIGPDEYLTWAGDKPESIYDPPISTAGRLRADQKKAIADHLSMMVDHLVATTAARCGPEGPVKVDLTAGIDTRTALALAFACMRRDRITVHTEGREHDLDMVVARRIAKGARLPHEILRPEPQDPGGFRAHLEVLAFAANGETDGKRALTDIFRKANFVDPSVRLCGPGALYRGPYYPLRSRSELLRIRPGDVAHHFQHKYKKALALPWRDDGMESRLHGAIVSCVERYARFADYPVDILDFFTDYERIARNSSCWARCSWWSQYFDPLSSSLVFGMSFRLPAPMGYGVAVNRRILARHLRRGYYLHLLNGRAYGPGLASATLSRRLARVLALAQGVRAKASRHIPLLPSGERGSLDNWYAAELARTAGAFSEEVLLSPGSLTLKLLKEDGVRSMLGNLGKPGAVPGPVGALLSTERWKEQILRIMALSQHRTPS